MAARGSDRPTDALDGGIGGVVLDCERIGPDLQDVPLAARRALDHAGLRVSLEAWRALSIDARRRIVLAGATAVVDTHAVSAAVRRASPPAQAIERLLDPDPVSPPPALVRAIGAPRTLDARAWARLRPFERYALAHAHRRSVARNDAGLLAEVFDAIASKPTSPTALGSPGLAGLRASPDSQPPPRDEIEPIELEPPLSASHGTHRRAAGPETSRRSPSAAPSERGADSSELSTHLTRAGEVRMVDVADKDVTRRRAVAGGSVRMAPATMARLARDDVPKGEVLATARVAGILAAKRTHDLVPLCHPLPLTNVAIHMDLDLAAARVNVTAVTETDAKTGVEMEALTAVSVACLTVYDMLKGIDRDMTITDIHLLEKSGGRTGHYRRDVPP